MLRIAESLVFWAFLALSSIALFPVAILIWALTVPFDKRRYLLHQFTCFWASLYTWFNPSWNVDIEGRDRIDSKRAVVLVANHLSLLDILVLFRLFKHFKWVSKLENFRVPFIGWNMRLNDYIPLRRGNRESIARMMQLCDRALAAGNSIMMFPEGTRSPNGRLRSFKPGAFELAIRNGVPIQPLVIRGTADALPKRGFVLKGKFPISVKVLEPIPPEKFAGRSAEELAEGVRETIAQELDDEANATRAVA